eukprot:935353-Pelagomonas_calceolata.AAC.1
MQSNSTIQAMVDGGGGYWTAYCGGRDASLEGRPKAHQIRASWVAPIGSYKLASFASANFCPDKGVTRGVGLQPENLADRLL